MWKKILLIGGIAVALFSVVAMSYNHGNEVAGEDIFYMVSHSEYWTGEKGQVIARLYNWQGNPITVDNCTTDIWYPDKTPFITDGLTDDSLQATTGTHYYNFTTPATEGVYQYMVTCNYNGKSRSVANSFHLSPALNLVDVINDSITTLTAQEQTHFDTTQTNLSTIYDGVVTIQGEFADIQINFSTVIDGIINLQTDVDTIELNLSDIYSDTTYIRENLLSTEGFNNNMSIVFENQDAILNNLTAIEGFCDDAVTSGSQLCLWVDEINNKVTDVNNTIGTYTTILNEINSTTHNTYDYITGTLATNVNDIFGISQEINATVTTIASDVTEIKSNVTTVIDNQEDVVYMEVTS